MNVDQSTLRKLLRQDLMETLIRIALIAFLVYFCVRVFTPFASLMITGLILAIALYPLFVHIVRWFGGKRGLAATAMVLTSLLLLGIPLVLLGNSLAGQVTDLYHSVENHTLAIKPPNPKIAELPLVGDKIYNTWNDAAANLPAYVVKHKEVIKDYARKALGIVAGGAVAVLAFLAALAVAGIMMVYEESGRRGFERILVRLTDPERGPNLLNLAVATVRSVAVGVVGVAFIQAILLGVGFLLAGIPGAGVLALLTMFLGILQLPALLISLPAVGYLWAAGEGSTTMKIIFSIYLVIAGMADNVLKPLLLGRGVDVPMLVVLIGAIGGMVTGGITGLFVGAVVLALSYKIFMEWVDTPDAVAPLPPAPSADAVRTDTPT
jgi:predicted PurR-regulated permease PerM